jgi:hypothetical protein
VPRSRILISRHVIKVDPGRMHHVMDRSPPSPGIGRSGGCRSSFRTLGTGEPLFWKLGVDEEPRARLLLGERVSRRHKGQHDGVSMARVVCVYTLATAQASCNGVVKRGAERLQLLTGVLRVGACLAMRYAWNVMAMRDRVSQPLPTIQRRQGCKGVCPDSRASQDVAQIREIC